MTQLKCLCLLALLLSACSRSNNLALGQVQATVGGHTVVVTDCYRTSVDPPQAVEGGFRFMPCRDADILIRGDELVVNGQSYGRMNPTDPILVDHGVVSINGRLAQRVAAPSSSSDDILRLCRTKVHRYREYLRQCIYGSGARHETERSRS